jgi:hypothetical protein
MATAVVATYTHRDDIIAAYNKLNDNIVEIKSSHENINQGLEARLSELHQELFDKFIEDNMSILLKSDDQVALSTDGNADTQSDTASTSGSNKGWKKAPSGKKKTRS